MQFQPVFDNDKNVLEIKRGLPQQEPNKWDYTFHQSNEIHMRTAARQIVELMSDPKLMNNTKGTIGMVPKKCDGRFEMKITNHAWGIRAVQGPSLFKFL